MGFRHTGEGGIPVGIALSSAPKAILSGLSSYRLLLDRERWIQHDRSQNTMWRRYRMKRDVLKAVHDDDLEAVLAGLGLHWDFTHGRLTCAFCSDTVTFENLHSMFPDSGAVKLSCSRPDCVKTLMLRIRERVS
jgi:hypothetical protein